MKFWQWFLWEQKRLHGPWNTMLGWITIYSCTCAALGPLWQAPGRLAQFCRTSTLCTDILSEPVELWSWGAVSTLTSLAHLLSLHWVLSWHSIHLSALGAGWFNSSLPPPARAQALPSALKCQCALVSPLCFFLYLYLWLLRNNFISWIFTDFSFFLLKSLPSIKKSDFIYIEGNSPPNSSHWV